MYMYVYIYFFFVHRDYYARYTQIEFKTAENSSNSSFQFIFNSDSLCTHKSDPCTQKAY